MNLQQHAVNEFKALGWLDESGNYTDEMQELVCKGLQDLLQVFADQGHSGFSAPYTIGLFEKLARFEPLGPLTGEDWEWIDVSEQSGHPLYQNKRASHVFKEGDRAYDINGKVFWDWWTDPVTGEKSKSHFTNKNSRVDVTFPYTPTTVYEESNED